MPTTERDAQALTYLAQRLRDETHGAGTWDHAGTYAAIAKLIGSNLYETCERVIRHAQDRDARTPGAIGRPFLPEPGKPAARRSTGPWCRTCGQPTPENGGECIGHDFETRADRKLAPAAAHDVVTELRGHLEPTKPRPEPAEPRHDPRADEVRAAMTQEETR